MGLRQEPAGSAGSRSAADVSRARGFRAGAHGAGRHRTAARRTFGFIVVLVVSCLAAACGSSGGSAQNATSPKAAETGACKAPSQVTIGGLGYGITLPGDVARLMGGFAKVEKECHTKIKFATVTSPQPLFANLLRGGYQFVELTVANEIQAATEGQNFQTVLTLSQGGSGLFATKNPNLGTGLSALKALGSNASVGMISVGGISSTFLKALWDAAGMDPNKVHQVPLGVAGIGPAVINGKLNMGYDQPTPLAAAIQSHQLTPILNTSGETAYKVTGFRPAVGLISVPSFTAKYPVLTAKISAAELQGIYWLRAHRNDPNTLYAAMPASFKASTSQASWDTAWKWNLSVSMPLTGQITQASVVDEAKMMQKYGIISSSFDVKKLASPSYVDSANVTAAYKYLGRKAPGPTDFMDVGLLKSLPK